MRGYRARLETAVVTLIAGILFFGFSSVPAHAQSANGFEHARDQIKEELSLDRNLMSYNRVSGLITDLLRDQKRLAADAGEKKNDENFAKAEDYLNEAGLYASQRNYDDCFKSMQAAFDILVVTR